MAATDTKQKEKDLSNALSQIERAYGKGAIMRMGKDGPKVEVEAISTGALNLDAAIGIGGVPRGRISEIYGPESSGKTTICLQVIAHAQRGGGIAAFIDAEHALDVGYARKLGVDVDNLLGSQHLEERHARFRRRLPAVQPTVKFDGQCGAGQGRPSLQQHLVDTLIGQIVQRSRQVDPPLGRRQGQ